MRGVWHNLKAVSPGKTANVAAGETLVCFSLSKQFSSELELDHDYHKIAGSLRRINLGINELDKLLKQEPGAVQAETGEKLESLKQSVKELDSYATHLLTQLGQSLGYL